MRRLPLEKLFPGSDGEVGFPRVTALVGAGGKTTLMYALADRMVAAGHRVICTTTTRIFPPDAGVPLILQAKARDFAGAAREALRAPSRIVVARRWLPGVGKLEGLLPETVDALARELPEAHFLVEADGAARKPLKAPAAHEPVFPVHPDCCVAVLGLDGVGRPLDDAHVHRAALVCAVAGQALGSPATPQTLARLVVHPEGLFRGCPPCRRLAFANKADRPGALAVALEAAALSPSVVWFAGSAAQGWCVPLSGKGDAWHPALT